MKSSFLEFREKVEGGCQNTSKKYFITLQTATEVRSMAEQNATEVEFWTKCNRGWNFFEVRGMAGRRMDFRRMDVRPIFSFDAVQIIIYVYWYALLHFSEFSPYFHFTQV